MGIITFKQSADGTTLDLYIYGAVVSSGYDWWTGEYIESETSADYFRKVLAESPNAAQINLYINSPGGSVMEGYGIYAQLKRNPANVTAYIDGFACSVASVIAMAADKVIMYGNSMMMIHEMMDCVCGNAKQLRKAADDLDKIMEGNIQVYLEKSGGKLEKTRLVSMLEAETWLTAEECADLGLADEISDRQIDPEKTAEVMKQLTNSIGRQMSSYKAARQTLEALMQTQQNPPGVPEPAPQPEPQEQINKPKQLMQGLFS